MPQFRHLQNPDTYLPGLWDLRSEHDARADWLVRLRRNIRDMVGFLGDGPDAHLVPRAEEARRAWESVLSAVEDDVATRERYPTVLHLVRERDRLLRAWGVEDVYRSVKARETADALRMIDEGYPLASDDVAEVCARVLAGNVFDMASPLVTAALAEGRLESLEADVRDRTPAQDDRTAMAHYLTKGAGRAVVCVDNAGSDFALGSLSLAHLLLRRGFAVVLAANEHPALNDVIVSEAREVVAAVADRDGVIADASSSGRLTVVSTGNGAPGIDFREVGAAFEAASEGCDLLILIGQGRAVEGGWRATFAVASLRIATIKSPLVADRMGVKPFDSIVRFCEPGEAASARS